MFNSNGKKTAAPIPPPSKDIAKAPEYALHPEAQRAVVEFSDAMKARDALMTENHKLREELKVQLLHRRELEHQLDQEKRSNAFHMAAVFSINSDLDSAESSIAKARQRASNAANAAANGQKEQPPPIKTVDELDAGIKQIAEKFAPKPEPSP